MSITGRAALAVLAVAVAAGGVAGAIGVRHEDRQRTPSATPAPALSVGWGGDETHPACVYDAARHRVVALITVDGASPGPRRVTVEVAAYADENTSVQVGSARRALSVDGAVHRTLRITMPVTRAPHVDEDGVAACSQHSATQEPAQQ